MDNRRRFGNASEVAAARFLEGKGYKILVHQFKTRRGEIDLVAEKDGELVFVEVKARRNMKFGYPEAAVRRDKVGRMAAAANFYLEENNLTDKPFRLDVVAMLLEKNGRFLIEHLEGVDVGETEW
jgi:putative endonuclease